jgi:hypothetical protein
VTHPTNETPTRKLAGFAILGVLALGYSALVFFDMYPTPPDIREAGGLWPALLRHAGWALSFAGVFVLIFSVFVAGSRRVRRVALAAAVVGGVAFAVLFAGLAYDHREYRDPETWAVAWHHVVAHTILYVGAFTSLVTVPWLVGVLARLLFYRGTGLSSRGHG